MRRLRRSLPVLFLALAALTDDPFLPRPRFALAFNADGEGGGGAADDATAAADDAALDDAADDTGEDTANAADDAADAGAKKDVAQDDAAGDDDDDEAAGADKSPFEQFGDPGAAKDAAKAGGGGTEAADAGDADELDKKLEAAEAALEADPTDPAAMRDFTRLNRQVRQRDAKERQRLAGQVRVAAEEAAYDQFERSCGLHDAPAQVRKVLSRDAIKKRFQSHFEAELKASGGDASEARGAARAGLRHEIRQIIAAAGKAKPAPKQRRTDTGAPLTPPGGAMGGRVAKSAPKPEESFIKGDWAYPNVDPDQMK